MDPRRAFPTADAYDAWINRRIGARVRHRREDRDLTAYRLGRLSGVTDQTIRNIEQDRSERGSLTGTLSRVACHLGIEGHELFPAAGDDDDSAEDRT